MKHNLEKKPFKRRNPSKNSAFKLQAIKQGNKEVEQEAANWRERYELVAAALGQVVYDCNFVTGQIIWGGSTEYVLGYHVDEMNGGFKQWSELIDPRDRGEAFQRLEISERNLAPYEAEYGFRHKAGHYVQILDRGFVVPNPGGRPERLIGMMQDVTERKRAEGALRESQENYRNLVESARDAIFTLSTTGTITSLNPSFEKMTGWPCVEWIGKPFALILHPDDLPIAADLFQRTLRGEMVPLFELRILLKSGEYGLGEITTTPQIERGKVRSVLGIARDITERKHAEKALKESEEKYRLLVENAGEAIFVAQDGKLKFANRNTTEITGYSKEELVSKPFQEFIHPDDRALVLDRHLKRLKGQELPSVYPFQIVNKSGSAKWVEINTLLITWEGRPATLNFLSDITERKQAEENLKESEEKYRSLVEQSYQGIVIGQGAPPRIVFANQAMAKILGYTLDEFLTLSPKEIEDLVHPEDRVFFFKNYEDRLEGKSPPSHYEIRGIRKDGATVWLELSSTRIDYKRQPAVQVAFLDITERKRVEEALRDSLERFRQVVDNAGEWIWEINADGLYTYASPAVEKILGYKMEEIVGKKHFYDFFLPNVKEELRKAAFECFAKKQPFRNFQNQNLTQNGKIVFLETNGTPVLDNHGTLLGYRGADTDITERMQAEMALKESGEKYRTILENIEDGYFEVDIAGNFTFFNDSMCKMLGYTKTELMGMNNRQYTDQENAKKLYQTFNKVYGTGVPTKGFDWEIVRKDGTKRYIEASVSLIKNPSGQPTGFRGIVRDITERKQAEEALLSEKKRFQTLSEQAPFGMVMIDKDGTFKYVNPKFKELFGYNLTDVPNGKTWFRKAYPDPTYRHHVISDWMNDLESTKPGEKRSRVFIATCKDGTERIINFISARLETGENLVTCEDFTDQIRAEEALRKSDEESRKLAQENATMAEIGRIIGSTLNIDEVYERFAERVRDLIPFDRVSINIVNPEKNTATMTYVTGVEVADRRLGDIVSIGGGTVTEECMRTRLGFLFQPGSMDEGINRLPTLLSIFEAGLQSIMFVPLISKDQVIGILHLLSTKPKAYTEQDLRLAERVGDQIAGAVANAQLFMQLKRTEEALRESERKFRDLYENAPLGYHEYDKEGRITKVNEADLEMLGYTAEELIGQPIWKLNVGEEIVREQVLAKLAGILPPGRNLDRTYRRKDGTTFPVLIEDRLILDEKGQINGIRSTIQDITGIKQAEESLQRSEERAKRIAQENAIMAEIGRVISSTLNIDDVYEHFAERVGSLIPFDRIAIDHINLSDHTTIISYATGLNVTDRMKGNVIPLAGTLSGEVVRTRTAMLVQTNDLQKVKDRFPGLFLALQSGLRSLMAIPLISKDEVIGVLHFESTKPYAYAEKDLRLAERIGHQIAGAIANAQLFMERQRTEKALRESEERYRTLAESAQDTIFIIDREHRFQYMNHFGAIQLGNSTQEIIGKRLSQVFPAEVAEHQMRTLQQVFESGKPSAQEIKMGADRWEDVRLIPILAHSGEVQSVMGIARDISEHKWADEALRKSEEKFQRLFNEAPVGYMEIDTEGCITQVNRTELNMLGHAADEMIGQPVWKFIAEEETARETIKAKLSGLLQCGKTTERTYKRKDGTALQVMIEDAFIRDAGGRVIGIHATIQDITERKRAEKELSDLQGQLRQSQKIEAIGQLAGGVAHDFNNLLTVIKGYTQLSLLDLKENSPLWENIQEIQKATQRATDLTRQLLAFSRRQILAPKVFDLNSLLRDTEKMLRRMIGEDIELITLLSEDLGRVKIDPGQIEQVIFNLAVNARDAMPSGGKLAIETANVEWDEEYTHSHIGVIPGHYVRLSVSDTGIGMSREVREKAFDPFFTTKEKGKGTGLGLSTVHGIVTQSGGKIWVYSEPGQGTTFKIYFPRVEGELDDLDRKTETDSFPRGSETVLLVEDEPSVRDLANRFLKQQGYKVLEAANGEEALRLVQEKPEENIHLLLTDVVLPQMGGKELADQLKIFRPGLKVLYTSGYTDYAIVHHGVLHSGTHFLQKPFSPKTLSQKVREVLDR